QLFDREAAHLAGVRSVRTGVIDDIALSIRAHHALAEVNHAVEAAVFPILAKKQQIAGTGAREIAADEVSVQAPQRLRIRKLEERAVRKIGRGECSLFPPKKRRAGGGV